MRLTTLCKLGWDIGLMALPLSIQLQHFDQARIPMYRRAAPRFGIEVDEALRVGGSGFLGESDAGESDPPGFLHQLQCPWPKDPNICSLRPRNHPILI